MGSCGCGGRKQRREARGLAETGAAAMGVQRPASAAAADAS